MTPILILFLLGLILVKLWATERKAFKEPFMITKHFQTFPELCLLIEDMESQGWKIELISRNKIMFVKKNVKQMLHKKR